MASFTFDETIAAPTAIVFDVLTDHRGYSAFTPLRKVVLEREGDPAPNGVGAIRKLHAIGPPLREEVTEYVPGSRLVYKLLSGAPLRDHVGTVDLTETADGGTRMVYRVDTTATVPLVGPVVVAITRTGVGQLAKGVAREAERRARA